MSCEHSFVKRIAFITFQYFFKTALTTITLLITMPVFRVPTITANSSEFRPTSTIKQEGKTGKTKKHSLVYLYDVSWLLVMYGRSCVM